MIFLTADNINIIIADNTKIQRHTEHYAKLINALTSEKRCKNRKPTHTVTAAATNDIQLFGLFILLASVFGYIYYNFNTSEIKNQFGFLMYLISSAYTEKSRPKKGRDFVKYQCVPCLQGFYSDIPNPGVR